jgi:ABC-type antimicrobial peptide transport system permease subunit
VVGVAKDMIAESPYDPIKPTVFYITPDAGPLNIRINPKASADKAISAIAMIYKKYAPGQPFDYQFADEEYAKKFTSEERIGKLTSAFAILAIFISCLGLFGMASFMTEQRTKEIGVRKVLGATAFNLWRLLSTDFVMLVIIALLISIPVSYYFMHRWLQGYQYHAAISWWIFAITAAGAVVITLLTVSYQSIKAALANPVKSLRSE